MIDEVGVVIGRFQNETLHPGHVHFINSVLRKHKNCLIILGESTGQRTARNPMTFTPRFWMIHEFFPNVPIVYVLDQKENKQWSIEVDKAISREYDDSPAIIYGSRDNSLDSYMGKHKTKTIESIGDYSGTTSRNELESLPQSRDFRRGLIKAEQLRFPTAYPTVDIALWQKYDNEISILLGKKKGCSNWCFPGGFVDPSDICLEIAARRELMEETTLTGMQYECGDFNYVGSLKIDDWRYRGEKDGIITTLFATQYIFGPVTANDDLESVSFFSLFKADSIIDPVHKPLLNMFKHWIPTQL